MYQGHGQRFLNTRGEINFVPVFFYDTTCCCFLFVKLNHRTEPKKLTTTTPLHASLAWSTRLEGGGVTKSWVVGVGFFHTENNYSEY